MKKVIIGIPTGNYYENGTQEFGRQIIIEYNDNEDLFEKLDNLSDEDYREGIIEEMHVSDWIAKEVG